VAREDWKKLDQSCVEAYLGQRVKITGTLLAAPLTRAGQMLVPDPDARAMSPPSSTSSPSQLKLVTHPKAQDAATRIAGVLTVSSVEAAPLGK
jgi:hypothetical protein